MALTAAQYRDKAEAALTKVESNAYTSDQKVAWSNMASAWAYLYVEQTRLDREASA